MKLTLEITMDNAAFGELPGYEAARILRELADWTETGGGCLEAGDGTRLRDINGNTVGKVEVVA